MGVSSSRDAGDKFSQHGSSLSSSIQNSYTRVHRGSWFDPAAYPRKLSRFGDSKQQSPLKKNAFSPKRRNNKNGFKGVPGKMILEGTEVGTMKFFEESKSYGFFVIEKDNSDIFVH